MEIEVREATVNDSEAAAAVYLSSAEHHCKLDPDFYRIPELRAVVARYRERIPNTKDDSVLLVAVSDDHIVGTSLARLMPEPSEASMLRPRRAAEIDVGVLPKYRGRGIGVALMSHAEQWANEHGATLALVNCHASNADAIRFYTQRRGYRQVGLLLGKDLSASADQN